MQEILN